MIKESLQEGLKDAKRLVEQLMSEYDPSTNNLFKTAERGDEAGVRAVTLMVACKTSGDPDVVEALLEEGCNPAAVDDDGLRAVDWATRKGNKRVIAVLRNV